MEHSELIAIRYSIRAYCLDPVEDEKLQLILEAARLHQLRQTGNPSNRW